ncbi:hypothetical protein [Pseudooceanicola nanhaiensis]|uniref:hypothetical protein n=1 Tax=Pseudooceanicola nanhaiensis TaxID=375761 RepID=UPI00351791B2
MEGVIWGYVLIGPGRPARATQLKVMGYAGADISSIGTVWEDELPARATRPQSQLTERNILLSTVRPGDQVHFADLLCLGVSPQDVDWFLDQLKRMGATAIIHTGIREIDPYGDRTEVLEDFEKARRAMHVRRSRAKKRDGG